jgi:hypothetical protein
VLQNFIGYSMLLLFLFLFCVDAKKDDRYRAMCLISNQKKGLQVPKGWQKKLQKKNPNNWTWQFFIWNTLHSINLWTRPYRRPLHGLHREGNRSTTQHGYRKSP